MRLRRFILSGIVLLCLVFMAMPGTPVEAAVANVWTTVPAAAFAGDTIQCIAVSPNYQSDKTIFALTSPPSLFPYSLWRTQNDAPWQKVFTAPFDITMSSVALSPDYGKIASVVYLIGLNTVTGVSYIWRSADAFTTWSGPQPAPRGAADGPVAVASDTALFLTRYDAGREYLCSSTTSGYFFTSGTPTGTTSLASLALSPSFSSDRTILAGDANGGVLLSTDGGATLNLVTVIPRSSLGNFIHVAFDGRYSQSRMLYALTEVEGGGIYSFKVGSGQPWQRLDTQLPANELLSTLAVSSRGVLYVLSMKTVAAGSQGGLLYCADPVAPAAIERVTAGLSDGSSLSSGVLVCVGDQLWTIDVVNKRIVTFIDTLSQPVQLAAPADNAVAGSYSAGSVVGLLLNWQPLDGAATYQWQISSSSDFASISAGFSGVSAGTQVQAPVLSPTGIYYWRVRAYSPLLGPWSAVWSFRTPSPPVEIGAPQLVAPLSSGAARLPFFQWGAVSGATGYELVVSRFDNFASPVISKIGSQKLGSNSWQSDVQLDYSTIYHWQVRAVTASGNGPWNSSGVFATLGSPAPTVTVTSPTELTQTTVPVTSTVPPTGLPGTTTSPSATTGSTGTAPPLSMDNSASPPPVAVYIPSATPDWVYYAVVGGALGMVLLVAAVLLLRSPRPPKGL